MSQIRFRDPSGSTRIGTLDGETIQAAGNEFDVDEVSVLPPVEPSKIVCIGRNYARHAAERGSDVPDRPMLFFKTPNALAAHNDTVQLPTDREAIEYEAELAVVIGKQCRNVSEDEAMEYVEGYTCMNDLSNRADQDVEQNWVRGKSFDNSAPLGPAVAPKDALPEDASIQLRVNGETQQDSSIEHLIFSIPELIAEITELVTLERGDVVATGTPEGVGPLHDGDRVEIEIEGVGTLEHAVEK